MTAMNVVQRECFLLHRDDPKVSADIFQFFTANVWGLSKKEKPLV